MKRRLSVSAIRSFFVFAAFSMAAFFPVEAVADIVVEIIIDGDKASSRTAEFKGNEEKNDLTLPLGGLEEGPHLISFRAKDDVGEFSTTVTRLLYVVERDNAVRGEYFVDNDPGNGSGTPINAGNGETVFFTVPTGNLNEGLHTLTVRSLNNSGEWTGEISRTFLVLKNCVGIEWFYGNDPGIGKGNYADAGDNGIIFLPTDNLDAGVHTVSFRSHDLAGNWSVTVTRALYVMAQNGFSEAEYYVDDDPGFGKGSTINIGPDGTATFNVPTENLEIGSHILTVRGKDISGNWITDFSAPFQVVSRSGVVNIEWGMNVKIHREGQILTLVSEDILSGSIVEIVDTSGMVLFKEEWKDTSIPFGINMDESHRNSILTITVPEGKRIVRRIR